MCVCVCVKVLCGDDGDDGGSAEKADVSAVSQAWFTTKEDKDTLANKGNDVHLMKTHITNAHI